VVHVWKRDHILPEVTAEAALALHSHPYVTIFLADEKRYSYAPLAASTGVAGGRNYLAILPMDASPFLSGDQTVTATFATRLAEGVADAMLSPPTPPSAPAVAEPGVAGTPPSAEELQAALAERERAAGEAARAAVLRGAPGRFFAPPSGVRALHVALMLDKPFLSPELAVRLNPLSVTLDRVRGLPGLVVDDSPALAHLVAAGPFDVPMRLCRPVYAVVSLFRRPPSAGGAEPGGGHAEVAGRHAAGGGSGSGAFRVLRTFGSMQVRSCTPRRGHTCARGRAGGRAGGRA
jgi:hypothetical protein